ncbi:MAG TPA: M23 family metallopeptidase [Candidatus Limnocylindrales bacterium]|jgi:murein DD-endopeptidase MepM/ murein hydrolase activator NlpD
MPAGRRVAIESRPVLDVSVAKPALRQRRRSLVGRVGHDRVVALAVVAILAGATTVSLSVGHPAANTGNTDGAGSAPRIAVGGDVVQPAGQTDDAATDGDTAGASGSVEFADPDPTTATPEDIASLGLGDVAIGDVEPLTDRPAAGATVDVEGPFTEDGTLVKPIAVDTTVRDGSALVKSYTVKGNETLAAIAARYDVSTMSIVWANNLKSKTDIHAGKVLRIPPVTGLIVKVTATDTLEAIAARYDVNGTDIIATNGLDDATLINGQVLVIPGAKGAAIPARPGRNPSHVVTSGNGSGVKGPGTYHGGKFLWPVVGGGNYISQYFHYGHYAIDIAADYGSTVRAAAAGTVTFAGWKNNGGGYQVWIAHGSGLYTTYNHMSAITVGIGQHVARGTQVGRIGMTGDATGPHCHFEVWRGPVWNGGTRVNPLAYF